MAKLSTVIVASCLLLGAAHADTLQMGGTENAARFETPGKPTRGMSQAKVEATYGSPNSKQAAVGDPPISRWEYGEFVVFFEYDKVIHAVSRR
ncbi:MAG: hypothetical protein OEW68_01560 [Gammaproteobacteria bacterium]|nr:hypothetical protein [Gammaproteobacteria bacterium]MDH4313512.1 hypothetical protein [Gammaproteobacteria bacterium]MDH5213892.1 hypothetical protein [Gammaproteobacteria bacterium]MDH5502071.1 hypothetical protein [Gammaproteobacteria bacterium]